MFKFNTRKFQRRKPKNLIFVFLHFSYTGVFEKWRCIHAPRVTSNKSEVPLFLVMRRHVVETDVYRRCLLRQRGGEREHGDEQCHFPAQAAEKMQHRSECAAVAYESRLR